MPLQLTGTWYWLHHSPKMYYDNVECLASKYEAIAGHFARITTYGFMKG
jgi:hypothetical protein